jgi:hypothetical protein
LKQGAALVALMQGDPLVFFLHPRQRCILGRIPACDIVLSDMSVSRKHAEIFPTSDGFHIRDLGSSNGVTVNQARLDNPYRLSGNDRILIGNVPAYFLETREPASHLALPVQRQVDYPASDAVAQPLADEAVSAARGGMRATPWPLAHEPPGHGGREYDHCDRLSSMSGPGVYAV